MEHRDVHAIAQLALDVEALRRLDVFKVYTTDRRLHCSDDVDQFVGVTLVELDIKHIDVGELLEQATLAFHDRLGGQRADVTQTKHRSAIGDDSHQIAARGVLGSHLGVCMDVEAGIGHTRRISQRQITLIGQQLGRRDGDLAGRWQTMVFARGFAQGLLGLGQLFCHGL